MTRVLRLLALGPVTGLVLLVSACGPFTYVSRVTFGASGDVAVARVNNAEKMAPYEYTAATAYLEKARLLAGYARFHDANNFGKRSRELAQKATEVAQHRERRDELPIFVPDGTMYITKDGAVRRGKPGDPAQDVDNEKPPLSDIDNEKPPLGDQPGTRTGKKGDPR